MTLVSRHLLTRAAVVAVVGASVLAAACGGGDRPDATAPAAAIAPAADPVDPATAGGLTGTVTFTGTAPAPAPITMTSDPRCMPEGGVATTETLLAGPGGALQNVFVYVKDGLGDLAFPVPSTPVVLEQKGCTYVPHVFGVRAGQPVEIVNGDPTLHNIHAMPEANQEFNLGQARQGDRHTHVFSAREVMVPVKCDVHRWMNAWVGVLDHPFYAVTDSDGAFAITGLPPGTYTIEAWHETLGTQAQQVTIAPRDAQAVAFSFAG